MVALFFRDGLPYTGIAGQQSYQPIKGEASVQVYPPCPRCSALGYVDSPNGTEECRRCNGSGHELRSKTVRVYTKERLAYLNKRAKRSSLSAMALKETKREYSQFVRTRSLLIERIQDNAHRNAELQSFSAMIQSGVVLSPSDIRKVNAVLRTLRP
jgi:ribosomal protein L40E